MVFYIFKYSFSFWTIMARSHLPRVVIIPYDGHKIFCPDLPPYENRPIIRNLDELRQGDTYRLMYNSLETYVFDGGPVEMRIPAAEEFNDLLTLRYIFPCKSKIFGYLHRTDVHGVLHLSELGVIPYEDGSWERRYYLASAK